MNVDDIMSDPAAPRNTGTTLNETMEALLESPASSQNQAQAHALAQIKANNWNTNKFREEYETAKSRLSDQKFNISRLISSYMFPFLGGITCACLKS